MITLLRSSHVGIRSAALALSGLLIGCGGGDGGSGGSVVQVPGTGGTPAPSPTPTPTPTPDFSTFGFFDLDQSQAFTSFSYFVRLKDSGGGFGYEADAASVDPDVEAKIRFEAPKSLFFATTGYAEVRLTANGGGGYSPDGTITQAGFRTTDGNTVNLYAILMPSGLMLDYSAYGEWFGPTNHAAAYPYTAVPFVYGVPAPQSAIPATGTRTYVLNLEGGAIAVDFARAEITGGFETTDGNLAQGLSLSGVTLNAERTGFSGSISDVEDGSTGTIEGSFTGPDAEEFIARLVTESDGKTSVWFWAGSAAN